MNSKILIIRFGSIGDIILTSPTVLSIKCNYPNSKIIYLTKEKFRPIVEMIDAVDEILTIEEGISVGAYFKFLHTIDYHYDIIFDLHGNFRSWMARKMLASNQKVSYPKRRIERSLIVKNHIYPDEYPHTIDLYNQTLEELKLKVYQHRPLLHPQAIDDEYVRIFLETNTQTVLIAPGASYVTKQYSVEKFAEAAVEIYKETNAGIIWADTEKEGILPEALEGIPESNFLHLLNHPIEKLASIIESADVTIANDSGIAHLSSSVNTPVIALFGPTHPVLGFAPSGMFDQIIHVQEECRPCSLHGGKKCYREKQFCFDNIEPSRIVTLAKYKLENTVLNEKAIFLDRDGTIIVDKDYMSDPNDVELIEGSVDILKKLQKAGYKLVVVSNQSGVARGKFAIESVEKINRHLSEILASENVFIDAFYYCPHHPKGTVEEYTTICSCRKPATGMIDEAIRQLQIDPRKSFVIGDKISDVQLGKLMGGKSILVRTGYGKDEEKFIDECNFYRTVYVADKLCDAGECILQE